MYRKNIEGSKKRKAMAVEAATAEPKEKKKEENEINKGNFEYEKNEDNAE